MVNNIFNKIGIIFNIKTNNEKTEFIYEKQKNFFKILIIKIFYRNIIHPIKN